MHRWNVGWKFAAVIFSVAMMLLANDAVGAEVRGAPWSISPKLLKENRERLQKGDEELQPALKKLLADADRGLKIKPKSVMDKVERAASGDPHDYFSIGIYWWPDPKKPDGLPWIRRDGERNPESRKDNDASRFTYTNKMVETLALAYYFGDGDREKYAAKATELIRVWYLNDATRMKPHMDHAQAVPGRNDGRSTGLIEAESLTSLLDGVELIRSSKAWTAVDDAALVAWVGEFYQWLRTSESGQGYEKAENNHGVYHDIIATNLALFLGKREEAEKRLRDGLTRRLDAQIAADGKQPRELVRTLSWSYSVFNLSAFLRLARYGEEVDVNWWGHRGPQGQSLQGALEVVLPTLDEKAEWTLGKQIKPRHLEELLIVVAQALDVSGEVRYAELLKKYGGKEKDARWWLAR